MAVAAWSGLFDGKYGVPYTPQFSNTSPQMLPSVFFLKRGMQQYRAILLSLMNNGVGSNATSTYTRVKDSNLGNNIMAHGGKQVVETVTDVNRNTAAADVTNLTNNFIKFTHDLTLKTDKGGNSIKGKANTF